MKMYHSHELFLFIDYFESLIKLFILKFLIYKVITCYKEFKREYVNAVDWEFISFWFKWASKKSGLDQLEHGNPWSQSAALAVCLKSCKCQINLLKAYLKTTKSYNLFTKDVNASLEHFAIKYYNQTIKGAIEKRLKFVIFLYVSSTI